MEDNPKGTDILHKDMLTRAISDNCKITCFLNSSKFWKYRGLESLQVHIIVGFPLILKSIFYKSSKILAIFINDKKK